MLSIHPKFSKINPKIVRLLTRKMARRTNVCYAFCMLNISLPSSFSSRALIPLLGGMLLLIGIGTFLYFGRQQIDRLWHIYFLNGSSTSTATRSTSTDANDLVTTGAIEPLLAPCRFIYRGSCILQAQTGTEDQTQPAQAKKSQPAKPVKYEEFALDDVFSIFDHQHSDTHLSTMEIALTVSQVKTYFPEYASDAEADPNTRIKQPVASVLTHISSRYNINPRLLLTLMELVRQGKGPLFSTQADINAPFSDSNDGFVAQFEQAGQELQRSEIKYTSTVAGKLPLPTEMNFFNKTYQVKRNANPEDLAIIEFLGNHLSSRQEFERAIKVFPVEQRASLTDSVRKTNFGELYTLLFQIDPIILP
jgi:hypothetical protein